MESRPPIDPFTDFHPGLKRDNLMPATKARLHCSSPWLAWDWEGAASLLC
jgi:hypothetical protein